MRLLIVILFMVGCGEYRADNNSEAVNSVYMGNGIPYLHEGDELPSECYPTSDLSLFWERTQSYYVCGNDMEWHQLHD